MKGYMLVPYKKEIAIKSGSHFYTLETDSIVLKPDSEGFVSTKGKWYRGILMIKNIEGKPNTQEVVEDGLISINQADLSQLMTLPGIGEVKAQAILDYRTQHGGFSSIEEIRQVKGIGESIFSQIKNKIKI